jgi:hypothetical protein
MEFVVTDEARLVAIRRLAERHIAANTATPEAARASLVRKGIYTPAGQLTPEYAQPQQAAPRRR